MTDKKTTVQVSYDNLVKDFLGACSDKNVVKFINKLYNEDFPLDSPITRLETETNNQGQLRRSDFMIKVQDRVFHIEVESNNNNVDMVFRMFEYGFRGAYMHGKTVTSNSLTLRFPDPVVIYLRSSEKTPTKFTVNLIFSNEQTFDYTIPIKRLADYTAKMLAESSLFALALFLPMNHEAAMTNKNHTVEDEYRFINEITSALEKLDIEKKKGALNSEEFDLILDGIKEIADNIISKSEIINREGVNKLMENTIEQYTFKPLILKEEGRKEGKIETARKMKQENIPIDMIQKCTDLPADTIQAL